MKWIKVSERLPDERVNVLAVEGGAIRIMALCYVGDDERNWLWGQSYDGLHGDAYVDDDYNVTHWMPMPEIPKPDPK